ncbi:MAG: hypothetical protein IJS74_03040 [Clostridia bacterium]|nr:hypothetical protein [Clostridia bacterium]
MKILILSSSAGNGHNSTANKIKNKILEKHSDYEIEIIDVYKSFASKFKSWAMSDGYLFACNHFVKIYNHFFKKSEHNDITTKDTNSSNRDTYCFLTGLLNKIYDFKPDLIISTYIFCTVGLTNLKRYYKIPAKIFCMTLDYGISPYWESASCVDKMFITGDYMYEPFIDKGYTKNQLVVSGIPVGEQFSSHLDKQNIRSILNLEKDLTTILVMKAGFFPISDKNLIKEFEKIEKPLQVILINGKHDKVKNHLDKIISKCKSHHKYVNLGFSSEIDKYISASDLVLTKAGGLTTTECLNKNCPMLIVDNLPQQEIYNKQYLVENGCAINLNKKYTISNAIDDINNGKINLNNMVENMKKIAKHDSLKMIIDEVEKIKPAKYTKEMTANHTKREVIKNIDRARKQTIKQAINKGNK